MAISGDYSSPVFVNGYQCWNCTQVDEAKKDINPADPQAGPFGIDAKDPGAQVPGRSAPVASPPPGVGASLDISV